MSRQVLNISNVRTKLSCPPYFVKVGVVGEAGESNCPVHEVAAAAAENTAF